MACPSWTRNSRNASPARSASATPVVPSAAIALLRPLRDAGQLPAGLPVTIHAVSGNTGRGRAGIDAHEGPQASAQSPLQVYGLALDHKHVPEIQQHALLTQRPMFVPAYGAYAQDIVLTIPLHRGVLDPACTATRVHEVLQAHHAAWPNVEVMQPAPGCGAAPRPAGAERH